MSDGLPQASASRPWLSNAVLLACRVHSTRSGCRFPSRARWIWRRRRQRDGIGTSAVSSVASGSSLGPMVGLPPTTGLREPHSRSHRALPRSPPPSPVEAWFGLDVTALQSRGHQEQRVAASVPQVHQEGQGRARVSQRRFYWSQVCFGLLVGPTRLPGRSGLTLGAAGERCQRC
jgi:hypothetical protein